MRSRAAQCLRCGGSATSGSAGFDQMRGSVADAPIVTQAAAAVEAAPPVAGRLARCGGQDLATTAHPAWEGCEHITVDHQDGPRRAIERPACPETRRITQPSGASSSRRRFIAQRRRRRLCAMRSKTFQPGFAAGPVGAGARAPPSLACGMYRLRRCEQTLHRQAPAGKSKSAAPGSSDALRVNLQRR